MGGDVLHLSKVATETVRSLPSFYHGWLLDPLVLGGCDGSLLQHILDDIVYALMVERGATSTRCANGASVTCRDPVVDRKADRGRLCRWCRERGKGR
mgnify:CR=1 FL=1